KLAEKFLINYFKEEKIPPGNNGSYVQEFTVISAKPDADLIIGEKKYDFLDQFYFYDKYTKDITINEFIFAGYGIETEKYNDYEGVEVSGKVVVILEDEPTDK